MVKDLSISLISLLILLILSSVLIRYIKFWRRQYLDSEQEIHDLDRVDSL
jgi:cell division protein FtsL